MKSVTITRPDGATCNAFYAEPASPAGAPGLVVIQEWWGVNDQIKGVAERYAAAGFRVLVPDLYRGAQGLNAKEAEHLMTGLNFADAAGQDTRGCVLHLKQASTKVGVTGYCMGGAVSLLAAVFVPEVDAVVSWYGFPPLEYVDATKITAPIMGHFATDDAFFPIAMVDVLENKLKEAHVAHVIHRYNATHAFANEAPTDPSLPIKYDPTAASTAWDRSIEFLRRNLS
ncbi:MAG: dienelactone hydrolase family protein [Vicinamibacterales bacterium]